MDNKVSNKLLLQLGDKRTQIKLTAAIDTRHSTNKYVKNKHRKHNKSVSGPKSSAKSVSGPKSSAKSVSGPKSSVMVQICHTGGLA